MSNSTNRTSVHGFTFVEIVVVIIILGIIITVATSGLDGVLDYSRHAEAEEELNNLAEAIAGDESLVAGGIRSDFGYVGDVGALPASLANLVANPGGYSTWKGPYVRDNFVENSGDYSTDPWGVTYTFTGGVTIQSTGSGSTITKQIANSTVDLTSNNVQGTVADRNGSPPGGAKDSVFVTITYPDGAGSMTTASVNPNSSGYYQISGIPIGNHSIQAVYTTANDTAVSIASVNPRVGAYVDILRFGSGYWFDTGSGGGGGGGGGGLTLVPGSQYPHGGNCDHFHFTIANNSGADITVSDLTLTWTSPTAYYEKIKWDVQGANTKVFDSKNPRAGSGDVATFSASQVVTNGSQIELKIEKFKDQPSGGGNKVDISNTTFTILFSDGSTFDIPLGVCNP